MDLSSLDNKWDLIVIGGGVTGAGVFREAVRCGLKVLLVEKNDFAWGTSSRSSKMVHGGLRYLKEGRILLTRTAVRERERLLSEAPGLVEPLEILVPVYSDHGPGRRALEVGLSIYDFMAHEKQHSFLSPRLCQSLVPHLLMENLVGGFRFWDAKVDDARLVLRLIEEGCDQGGSALNYVAVEHIDRDAEGAVTGVGLIDGEKGIRKNMSTRAVVNATGAWAERLHASPKENLHLRPLRGSHLIFSQADLPISQTVSFFHKQDKRPIFISPWEGVVLLGTTDMDHGPGLDVEPTVSEEEAQYLMQGLHDHFPFLNTRLSDCVATLAGIRPVLSEGKRAPSQESRDSVVWVDNGLVTVTGGKLTTFRKMAVDTLKAVRPFLPSLPSEIDEDILVFDPAPGIDMPPAGISQAAWRRICGRYGSRADELVHGARPEDLCAIPGTETLWCEIPFAARYGRIRHLSDLMLRRVRLGLLVPDGGRTIMDRVKHLCRPLLPWDNTRWVAEISEYLRSYKRHHGVPKIP
ncbi:MAG: glycerol-3-phosphate dehydrogenase/oxidase, partial [Desulfosarcinaceae bacterium]